MDWQRNDRLGRSWQQQLFEHRRQVLRGRANTHTNADAYSNVHANSDANTNCITYSYSNANADPDTNAMRGEMCTHAEAAPDSGTAPVACNVSWKRFYTSRVTPGQILRSTPVKARNDNSITRNQRRP